jgi:hypothetical protein
MPVCGQKMTEKYGFLVHVSTRFCCAENVRMANTRVNQLHRGRIGGSAITAVIAAADSQLARFHAPVLLPKLPPALAQAGTYFHF